jgi:hypothetical protein
LVDPDFSTFRNKIIFQHDGFKYQLTPYITHNITTEIKHCFEQLLQAINSNNCDLICQTSGNITRIHELYTNFLDSQIFSSSGPFGPSKLKKVQ